jgi:predicted Zn-dependent protease
MKLNIIFGAVIVVALAAVILSERRAVKAEVSPAPILYFVADTERELTRVPVMLTRISDDEEIKAGEELARGCLEGRDKDDSQQYRTMSAYVSNVGQKVAHHAHRNLPYKFHYLPDDYLVNAFALPGGHVFIGKGLLNLMDTEDELASVLGHEVEHVDLGHAGERVQIEMRLKKLPFGEIAALPIELFQAGYTKQQELEADREGTKLAVAAGYSPEGAISMFERYQKLQEESQRYANPGQRQPEVAELPIDIANVVVLQTLEEYFRSHPPEQERIAQIQQLIAAEHWPTDRKQRPLEVAYVLEADQAAGLFNRGEFDKAVGKANTALAEHPGYVPALNVLGDVAFERAEFASAATQYRKSLDLDPRQEAIAQRYASSLSASVDPRQAAQQYSAWLDSAPEGVRQGAGFAVEEVGLKLLAGDAEQAKHFAELIAQSDKEDAPLIQGRLGWWYYRANDAETAEKLLTSSVEQRSQDGWLNMKLGWALTIQKKYESAQQRFYAAASDSDQRIKADAEMGLAITEWQARQREMALDHYRNAVQDRKAWSSPRWVTALYGGAVSATVSAIQREDEIQRNATNPHR